MATGSLPSGVWCCHVVVLLGACLGKHQGLGFGLYFTSTLDQIVLTQCGFSRFLQEPVSLTR